MLYYYANKNFILIYIQLKLFVSDVFFNAALICNALLPLFLSRNVVFEMRFCSEGEHVLLIRCIKRAFSLWHVAPVFKLSEFKIIMQVSQDWLFAAESLIIIKCLNAKSVSECDLTSWWEGADMTSVLQSIRNRLAGCVHVCVLYICVPPLKYAALMRVFWEFAWRQL